MRSELLRIGHVAGTFGVSGGVKLFVIGRPDDVLDLRRVYVEDTGWLRVRTLDRHGPGVVVTFVGVEGKDAAERLKGRQVFAHEAELPPLPDDEFYYHELRGLRVVTPGGEEIGVVEDVMDAGHQDLLVVAHGGRSSLVPLQAPYVEVRREGARGPLSSIVLDAPAGLLGDEGEG
ncbi:ribosome maturation factor RimM [Deinococcus pimensis]|uniref:ribosome maturation factor RimM n=1 Tax=Deinococcus pimensis TaxID=309888 RepID=UPI0004820B80|nr:ribosome maturation factor RimM [Deinococcus pimensis]